MSAVSSASAAGSTAVGSTAVETLRRERDRFAALAFCAADVLIEVDAECVFVFAAGATNALLGQAPGELVGHSLLEVADAADREAVRAFVGTMTVGHRPHPISLTVNSRDGTAARVQLSGYRLPQIGQTVLLAMRILQGEPAAPVDLTKADAQGFAERASRELRAAQEKGEDVSLTMVRLHDLEALRARVEPAAGTEVDEAIGKHLSGDGGNRLVGRLDDENYGVVHRADVDIEAIKSGLQTRLAALDPSGKGVEIAVASAGADVSGLSQADLAKALHYTLRSFCEEDDPATAIGQLTQRLESGLALSSQRLQQFRQMVASAKFDVALQPIVFVTTGVVEHFEALVRFNGDVERSPYELITFAENAGLICDFDHAMCKKVLELLARTNAMGYRLHIAVNLSGNSIVNPAFVVELFALLQRHARLRSQLIIEITESARIKDLPFANRFIQSLRKEGHVVCLDDFGAGAAAFQYLHDIEVDVVKIDGQYIRGACHRQRSRALLKAIAGLCKELGIVTVAEMIEDMPTLEVVKSCGIDLGQGYLYGKPSIDIDTVLAALGPPAAVARRGAAR